MLPKAENISSQPPAYVQQVAPMQWRVIMTQPLLATMAAANTAHAAEHVVVPM
jgi:hypothetical protein